MQIHVDDKYWQMVKALHRACNNSPKNTKSRVTLDLLNPKSIGFDRLQDYSYVRGGFPAAVGGGDLN